MGKRVIWTVGLCCLTFCCNVYGQQESGTDERAARMEQMMDKRAESVADKLKLEGDARTEFLTTYKAYQQELMSHRKASAFPQRAQKKIAELTEEEAEAYLKKEFDRKAQRVVDAYNTLEVDKKYYELFAKTLSAKQLMEIFMPERNMPDRGRGQSRGRSAAPRFGGGDMPSFPGGGFGDGTDW